MHASTLPQRPRFLLAAALLTLAACGEPTGVRTPDEVETLVISPGEPSLFVGESLPLAAVPLGPGGRPLTGREITWTSNDPDVATVTPAGHVYAHAHGQARITATAEGVSAHAMVSVMLVPAHSIVLDVAALALREGDAQLLQATVRDALGRPLEGRAVTWASASPTVATVTPDGRVLGLREGRTTITVSHGAIASSVEVDVSARFTADLLFDSYAPNEMGSRVFRADPSTGLAAPITPHAGLWDAVASPDGSRIAFTCSSYGSAICVADADGTDIEVLTDGETHAEDQPSWSPDGTRIAFRRWPHGASPGQFNPTDIWVMDADGTDQVNLTDDGTVQGMPAWSPVPVDGAYRIAYTQEGVSSEGYIVARLYTMRPDGTARAPLTAAGDHADSDAAWSPDGHTVVFTRVGGAFDGELRVVDVLTLEERSLLSQALDGEQRHPAWSPDGRHIAFTSAHEASPAGGFRRQVYTVRADGSSLTRRTTSDIDKERTAWLPRP